VLYMTVLRIPIAETPARARDAQQVAGHGTRTAAVGGAARELLMSQRDLVSPAGRGCFAEIGCVGCGAAAERSAVAVLPGAHLCTCVR